MRCATNTLYFTTLESYILQKKKKKKLCCSQTNFLIQSYVYNWGCLCGCSNLFVSMKAQSSEEEAIKKLQMQRAGYLIVEN